MRRGWLLVPLGLIACGCSSGRGPDPRNAPAPLGAGVTPAEAPPEGSVVDGQTIYVPAYSHVDSADNARSINLAATMFVRNVDPARPIVVTSVRYHDSGGRRVRDFLDRPIRIAPLASASFFVGESDVTGGASPSFLVDWSSVEPVASPMAESVMISTAGTQGITLNCQGRVVASKGKASGGSNGR